MAATITDEILRFLSFGCLGCQKTAETAELFIFRCFWQPNLHPAAEKNSRSERALMIIWPSGAIQSSKFRAKVITSTKSTVFSSFFHDFSLIDLEQ